MFLQERKNDVEKFRVKLTRLKKYERKMNFMSKCLMRVSKFDKEVNVKDLVKKNNLNNGENEGLEKEDQKE